MNVINIKISFCCVVDGPMDSVAADCESSASAYLPERLSPDGGEAWSDWDDQQDEDEETSEMPGESVGVSLKTTVESSKPAVTTQMQSSSAVKKVVDDLDALDIKAAKITVSAVEKVINRS
jgi:hypothetical protein